VKERYREKERKRERKREKERRREREKERKREREKERKRERERERERERWKKILENGQLIATVWLASADRPSITREWKQIFVFIVLSKLYFLQQRGWIITCRPGGDGCILWFTWLCCRTKRTFVD
jgi:ATP-dependent 26S proteasome regulatory subunit